ncbi:MAG TPA: hypothetical protein VGD91_22270 [Trebonia sp.]
MVKSVEAPGAVGPVRWCTLAAGAATAAVLLAACSSGLPVPPPAPAAHTASLDVNGHSGAILDVLTGTTVLTIGTAVFAPGGPLLQVSTPAGGPAPQLSATGPDGTLVDLAAGNATAVTVTLNAAVSWQLELDGGSTRTSADLRGGQVTGIAFNAGSSVISLALPRPHGSVPVQMTGGASQFLLSLPGGVPARVTAAGGAGEVTLEGQNHSGVAGGSVFTTAGWAPGVTGFDIDATAGASRIAVTARAG